MVLADGEDSDSLWRHEQQLRVAASEARAGYNMPGLLCSLNVCAILVTFRISLSVLRIQESACPLTAYGGPWWHLFSKKGYRHAYYS